MGPEKSLLPKASRVTRCFPLERTAIRKANYTRFKELEDFRCGQNLKNAGIIKGLVTSVDFRKS